MGGETSSSTGSYAKRYFVRGGGQGTVPLLDFIYPEDLTPQDAVQSQPSPKAKPCTKNPESNLTSELSQLTL